MINTYLQTKTSTQTSQFSVIGSEAGEGTGEGGVKVMKRKCGINHCTLEFSIFQNTVFSSILELSQQAEK